LGVNGPRISLRDPHWGRTSLWTGPSSVLDQALSPTDVTSGKTRANRISRSCPGLCWRTEPEHLFRLVRKLFQAPFHESPPVVILARLLPNRPSPGGSVRYAHWIGRQLAGS